LNKALDLGTWVGKFPYGYTNNDEGEMTIVDKEAEVISKLFDLYINDHMGSNRLSDWLNDNEIKTRHGKDWSPSGVTQLLKLKLYKGVREYNNKIYSCRVKVDPKIFDEAQRIRTLKKQQQTA
jgi:hypothetical protein